MDLGPLIQLILYFVDSWRFVRANIFCVSTRKKAVLAYEAVVKVVPQIRIIIKAVEMGEE